jgi:DNA modification methylase
MNVNQIILGDCLEVMSGMSKNSVDLVLTDIPYNEVNRQSNGLRKLDKGQADVLNFDLQEFLVLIDKICSGSFYIFCGTLQVSNIMGYFRKRRLSTRLCIWEKTNPSPMNGKKIWLSGVECCVFAKKKSATFNEHCQSPVWRYSSTRNKLHATQKPLKLFSRLIKASSNSGDVVFDPCVGSGTTAVAAYQLKRSYLGIENDQDIYKIAINRISLEKDSNPQENQSHQQFLFPDFP